MRRVAIEAEAAKGLEKRDTPQETNPTSASVDAAARVSPTATQKGRHQFTSPMFVCKTLFRMKSMNHCVTKPSWKPLELPRSRPFSHTTTKCELLWLETWISILVDGDILARRARQRLRRDRQRGKWLRKRSKAAGNHRNHYPRRRKRCRQKVRPQSESATKEEQEQKATAQGGGRTNAHTEIKSEVNHFVALITVFTIGHLIRCNVLSCLFSEEAPYTKILRRCIHSKILQ